MVLLFLMFLRCFFASIRAAFYTVKMISIPSQVAKSRTLICLVPLSLLRPHLLGVGAASSDGAMFRPTKYTRVTKRRRRWVVARAQQSAWESAHTKVERVTKQLSHNTISTAHEYNGTWSTSIKKKNAVSSPYHAGLFCNRVLRL